MKRFLVLAGVLITFSVPISVKAAAHAGGTNVLSKGTIYMITSDGQLRPYTSAGAFLSYGFNNWSTVKNATTDDLTLPIGSFIPPRDGKVVCSDRSPDQGTCYLITNSKKAGFTNETVFKNLGFNFGNVLYGDVSFLQLIGNIDASVQTHLPGTLINDNGTIKLVGSGGNVTVGIPSMATLRSWGYSLSDVVPATSEDQALQQNDILGTHQPGWLTWADGTPPNLLPFTTSSNSQNSFNNSSQQNFSANTLYSTLSPQLAYITCNWDSRLNGAVLGYTTSNGLLTTVSNGSYVVITSLGGVTNANYPGVWPVTCNIQFPAGTSLFAGGLSNFTVGSNNEIASPVNANPPVDAAQVIIAAPNQYAIDYAKSINYCPARPLIGDLIAVFGWPTNSPLQTLTGSITGTSSYYDITNIQVLDGMQGSTAVSLTKGCVIGQINSSGNIIDQKGLSYTLGF